MSKLLMNERTNEIMNEQKQKETNWAGKYLKHQHSQKTRYIDPMLFYHWTNVLGAGPKSMTAKKRRRPSVVVTLDTLAQHWNKIGTINSLAARQA